MADASHKPCKLHHPTDAPGVIPSYPRCCCGETWLVQLKGCADGCREGEEVTADPQERMRRAAQNAPYLLIQMDGLVKENKELKERLEGAADIAAEDIWARLGGESLIYWKHRAEQAEEALREYEKHDD